MNDIIFQLLSLAGIPASKDPTSLTRLDGKHPDGLARGQAHDMGHHSGQYACSVLPPCLRSLCCWRRRTCCLLEGGQVLLSPQSFPFVPIALETLGAIAPCSLDFLTEVGRQLSVSTGDACETAFLFQRISVALQRFNAVLIYEFFVAPDIE